MINGPTFIAEDKVKGRDFIITVPNSSYVTQPWPLDAADYELTPETLCIVVGPQATDEAIDQLVEKLPGVPLYPDGMKRWRDWIVKEQGEK